MIKISKIFLTDETKQRNDSGLLEVMAVSFYDIYVFMRQDTDICILWHLYGLHKLKILFLMF